MKKKMENFKSHFKITDNKDVIACGIPALDGDNHGRDLGNDIAAFWGKGKTFILVNMRTGKLREFVNADGQLLVEDKDIDYDSIHRHHNHYHCCVDCKRVEFGFNRYNDFKNGLCALVWTTYPDGRYFADEDGFGMENICQTAKIQRHALPSEKNIPPNTSLILLNDYHQYHKNQHHAQANIYEKNAANGPCLDMEELSQGIHKITIFYAERGAGVSN